MRGYIKYLEKPQIKKELEKLNPDQISAVKMIIANKVSFIRGPPGSGKTSMAALALSILKDILVNEFQTEAKILIVADSNKAVDRITEALLERNMKVLRLVSNQHEEYIKIYGGPRLKESTLNVPNLKKADVESALIRYLSSHFISCTLSRAGCLLQYFENLGLVNPKFYFTLVDEGSQSTELKTLNAIQRHTNKLIIIGDDKQLPPVIHNQYNMNLGYNSFLYNIVRSHSDLLMELGVQYRMHHEIAAFSNINFYSGKLMNSSSILSKRILPPSFSRVFADINNPKVFVDLVRSRESFSSKSYSNRFEAKKVIEYIQALNSLGVQGSQIGVITFYKSQVIFLEELIKKVRNIRGVIINTVDAFQGSEMGFIILSTVRANHKRAVGFLTNENRLNVALTRSRLGLIILGNARTLKSSLIWHRLISYCSQQKCLVQIN